MRQDIQKVMTTATMQNSKGNFLDTIMKYWQIILAIIFMIAGYTTLQNDYSNLKAQTDQNSTAIAAAQTNVLAANASYGEVAGDIKGINAKLDIIIKHDGL